MPNIGEFYGFEIELFNSQSLFRGFSIEFNENLILKFYDSNGDSIKSLDTLIINDGNTETTLYNVEGGSYSIYVESQTIFLITAVHEGKQAFAQILHNGDPEYIYREIGIEVPTHKVLSTKPSNRIFHKSIGTDYLYFTSFDNDLDFVHFLLTYSDNTTAEDSQEISSFNKGHSFYVPIMWDRLNTLNPEKTIKYFDVYISDLFNKVRYYPRDPISDNAITFYYRNSLGGFDSLVCEGDHQNSMEAEEQVFKKNISKNYSFDTPEYIVKNQLSRDLFTANTGFKPADEIRAIKDMIHVNDVYIVSEELSGSKALIPIRILTKSITLPSNWSNIKNISFQYQYNFDNRAINKVQ